ncbi:hypothetical protein HanPI659440_Chr00c01g0704131 [Helianthus annuus]|nr:hypothetical protein HanPI659440_Chr00c01g0704131 [Helianthus annuus]
MDDSGAILCQLSALKDMLDQVNEEIEANFQITRDIESEIVKCSEIERTLAVRESELMKTMYMLQFEIKGLMAMNGNEIFSNFLRLKLSTHPICLLYMPRTGLYEAYRVTSNSVTHVSSGLTARICLVQAYTAGPLG